MVAEKIPAEKSEAENNLTISTKLSTDQLICKSPISLSSEGSVRELTSIIPIKDDSGKKDATPVALYLGLLQILFGLLMAVFGVLVLVHESSLSQVGAGLWGGCLATLTGVLGVLSAARDCCPLKTSPQRIALTAFLALSLVSVAVAHLVLVLAAIGLARDAANAEDESEEQSTDESEPIDPFSAPPLAYTSLLAGAGLVVVCACECVAAVLSAYQCARLLCPCFRKRGQAARGAGGGGGSECAGCNGSGVYAAATPKAVLVSSWLGNQTPPAMGMPPLYVVANNQRRRGTPVAMAPVFPMPTPPPSLLSPAMMGYPLIPAPLGHTPPPMLHPHHPPERVHKKRRRYPSDRQLQQQYKIQPQVKPAKKQKKSRDKQKTITTEEVAKTYTGLDRVIAEEFIEICDSARTTSASGSDSGGCTTSETSHECVVERL